MKIFARNQSLHMLPKEISRYKIIRQVIFTCLLFVGTISKILSQEYFQQEVNYKIDVLLDDRLHELNAFETLDYINHSPDTLNFLYFHLWPNAYSNNNTALAKQMLQIYGKQRLFNAMSAR